MAIEITHIQFEDDHHSARTISHYRWMNCDNGKVGQSRRSALVDWVRSGGIAYVSNGDTRVEVGVTTSRFRGSYLESYVDGEWTNDLKRLPTFQPLAET